MDRSQIKMKTIFISILLIASTLTAKASDLKSFKFHSKSVPVIDPSQIDPSDDIYIFTQLFRGLTRLDGHNQLIFDQAKKCKFKTETLLICELRKEAQWSDHAPVTAEDFVKGFARLVSPKSRCPAIDLLFGIKNAKEIYEGKLPLNDLGVKALSPKELSFELREKDLEFLEKLSNPLLVPYREGATNGPYKIKSWPTQFESFPDYFGGAKIKPPLELIVSKSDSDASLYDKGAIDIRILPASEITKYKNLPGFSEIPQSRFDYIGFNLRVGQPLEKKEWREALTHAINPPGCPGLIDPLIDPEDHCQTFLSTQEKIYIPSALNFFMGQSTDDFYRKEWQDHLGVPFKKVSDFSKLNPPDLFKVEVTLNRPTCLAALEKFVTKAPENYVGFSNIRFDNLAKALSRDKLSMSEKASICGVASDILFKEEYVGIPLGKTSLALLVRPQFKGWTLNQLGQLDLSQLTYEK